MLNSVLHNIWKQISTQVNDRNSFTFAEFLTKKSDDNDIVVVIRKCLSASSGISGILADRSV